MVGILSVLPITGSPQLDITFDSMKVVLDFGNTRVKMGIFESGILKRVDVLNNRHAEFEKSVIHYIQSLAPKSLVWVASGFVPDSILKVLEEYKAVPFSAETQLHHSTCYKSPHSLGLDRKLNMEAAFVEFPNQNTLVIDAGTCITYDLLNSEGIHVGGAISPGWRMRLRAMNEFTAALPLAEAAEVDIIGVDTETSLQSGAYHGMRSEMNETIRQYEERYPNLNVVLTGGDGESFDLQAKKAIFARPNYTLHGLNAVQL